MAAVIEYSENPLLIENISNLNQYLENLKCLHETFSFSEKTLVEQLEQASKQFNHFLKTCKVSTSEEHYNIPNNKIRLYRELEARKKRAELAFNLIPPSYLVSLVSLYDSFLSGLVRNIYNICPEKLNENNSTFCYRDVCQYNSIQEIKQQIIDDIIDNLLRESHIEQIKIIAKLLGVNTLTKFEDWSAFVELTERRNLFVHTNGKISSQYIEICRKNSIDVSKCKLGEQLIVDKAYFTKAYEVLYIMGIMLSQMVLRCLLLKKGGVNTEIIDRPLIEYIFDLIYNECYEMSINVSKFALGNKMEHTSFDKSFFVLNLAQAYKWIGNISKCEETLKKEDWGALRDELIIPKLVLENKFIEACERIEILGNDNKILTMAAYREWPIFKELRKEKQFVAIFKTIFHEDLLLNNPLTIEKLDESSEDTTITIA